MNDRNDAQGAMPDWIFYSGQQPPQIGDTFRVVSTHDATDLHWGDVKAVKLERADVPQPTSTLDTTPQPDAQEGI